MVDAGGCPPSHGRGAEREKLAGQRAGPGRLAPLVVERLLQAVRTAASDDGVAVLLVEQHIRKAIRIADHVLVMRRGRVVLEGSGAELRGRVADIEAAYMAAEDAAAA